MIVASTNENIGIRKLNGIDPAGADVTADDIRALFGVLLRMGMLKAQRLNDYWDEKLGWDPVRTVLSRDRFRTIFRSLSVSANAPQPNPSDRLAAVQNFVDELNKRFAAALIPGEWVCIDETMIEFRGDHDSVQFLPKKPIPLGFKCFTISNSFGYVLCQRLYEGKTGGRSTAAGLTERVVLQLMEPYGHAAAVAAARDDAGAAPVIGPHRTVTMDSFYSGAPLFKKLFDDNTLAVGTLNPTRAMYPKELNDVKLGPYVRCERTHHHTTTTLPLRRADTSLHRTSWDLLRLKGSTPSLPLFLSHSDTFAVRQNVKHPELVCVACDKDGKRRLYLSTASEVPMNPKRYKPNSSDEWLTVPSVVPLYNRRMWTVDCSNQYAANDTPHRRSPRWWLSIVLHYFHVAVVNAYLLYSRFGHESLPTANTFHAFRKLLADELVAGYDAGRGKIGRPSIRASNHTQEQSIAPAAGGRRERGNCGVCCHQLGNSRNGTRSRSGCTTSFRCAECSTRSGRSIWVCDVRVNDQCWHQHCKH